MLHFNLFSHFRQVDVLEMQDKFQVIVNKLSCWLPQNLTNIVEEYMSEFGGEYIQKSRIMVSVKACVDELADMNLNQRLEWSCFECKSELIFQGGWIFDQIHRMQQNNESHTSSLYHIPKGELPFHTNGPFVLVRCMHNNNVSFQLINRSRIFLLRAETSLAQTLYRLTESYPIEWCGVEDSDRYAKSWNENATLMSLSIKGNNDSQQKILATIQKNKDKYIVTRIWVKETILDIQFHGDQTFILTPTHLRIYEDESSVELPPSFICKWVKHQLFVLYATGGFAIRVPKTDTVTLFIPKRFQSRIDLDMWK